MSGLTRIRLDDGRVRSYGCEQHGDVTGNVVQFDGCWFCCRCVAELLKGNREWCSFLEEDPEK